MGSSDDQNKLVEYDRLNSVGKAVFIAGSAYRVAEKVIGYTFTTLQTIWEEAEKAFAEGNDPASDDAVIIEETGRDDGQK